MHESTVSDYCNGILFAVFSHSLVETVEPRTACPHADIQIHGIEGSNGTESIATDITVDIALVLFKGIENSAVRTSGTHYRRTGRNFNSFRNGKYFWNRLAHYLANKILAEFTANRELVFSKTLDAKRLNISFDDRIKFFHDIQIINF